MREQETVFKNGNEMAALAATQMNFHVMGYFPITPSTGIPEELSAHKAEGHHEIVLIPADGEHGAAGICYGASLGGGRVINATSANGLLYALEQLPVQSGTRAPMILNVVARSVSGPLDIKGDHSDIMYTLNAGWVILMAKDPQRVYDFNIISTKVAEHPDVMLPVIITSDGFFTSHQKRRNYIFKENQHVQDFIGEYKPKYTALDPENPITFGPYMNEPDLINNKVQLSRAMDKAYEVLPKVMEEYGRLTGRYYNLLETYKMEDAEACLFILNSSFDTATEAVDILREQGKKVGVVSANVIRPWPKNEIQKAFKNVKGLCVADRQESYGAKAGNMSIEIRATLKDDPDNKTQIFSRIYGVGGKEFYVDDAIQLLEEALQVTKDGKVEKEFDYIGAYEGNKHYEPKKYVENVVSDYFENNLTVEKDEKTNTLNVKGVNTRSLTVMPKRISPGHQACPGCGIFPNLNLLTKGLKGYVVFLFHTGCGMVVTTAFPNTAFRTTYIHNLFQNGAATLSGVVEMFHEKQRRGELDPNLEITFVMVSGDGGMDIGMGPAIGTALRNHNMIIFEYDNGGYMNTGYQLSYTTPHLAESKTSIVGPAFDGKSTFQKHGGRSTFHKDTPMIMAGTHIPYVATVAESHPVDYVKKAAKAQYVAQKEGLAYIKAISACPLNWKSPPEEQRSVIGTAVESCYFPLFEIYHGITKITYDPEKAQKKMPVSKFFERLGVTKHLLKANHKDQLDSIQNEVDRRWNRLKAYDEHPLL
ncbi:thiamine pyrophosphate-dependent enzyme [Alkaliphilus hydrothermalis]|uniref:Pyruvate ferredoxin oxidoreductase alpha subunit n=1 Tax=Alkaliphilus hydrothermalis TaxID=1482730 RepID=A0ABS2NU32_9FIRM|nr:thiamine pyrophosphate-dependent enzyme [Alkaliphilus hydrothermalis]MBM7616447.1 pyruvate ferredoxin oxidoreductase alpha subunit [Alkaliphilus hydrothermalis]